MDNNRPDKPSRRLESDGKQRQRSIPAGHLPMKPGRPRRLAENFPAHIDIHRLPKGCYWDKRASCWYTIHIEPKQRWQRIADAKATLADLHRILEDIGGIQRGTVGRVLDEFHKSETFKKLSPRTRDDYEYQRELSGTIKARTGTLDTLVVSRLTVQVMQRIIDAIAVKTPTKANHLLRYWRRTFKWGIQRGECDNNPCQGVEQAKERKRRRRPDPEAVLALTIFARERGGLPAHSEGSCSPYLWIMIEIGYLCRLRPIETLTLTDANVQRDGLLTNRRKGSRDSLVLWTPRLRAAIDAASSLREKQSAGQPVPIRPEDRRLIVTQDGAPLSNDGLNSAWQRLIRSAIKTGTIQSAQRFGLHDLKRKGITDTPGTRGEKQLASGHKAEAMLDIYDYSVPSVKPAGE